MAHYLVTGGLGFIGSHTCKVLLYDGNLVTSLDSPSLNPRKLSTDKLLSQNNMFRSVSCDISDKVRVADAFKYAMERERIGKIDGIIHLAGRAGGARSMNEPELYYRTNVVGTSVIITEAINRKIPSIAVTSTSLVYGKTKAETLNEGMQSGEQETVYSATKHACEEMLRLYSKKINVACLRPFSIYGERGREEMAVWKFTEAILSGKPIQLNADKPVNGEDTTVQRDFLYVGDAVTGILSALNTAQGFKLYNLGSGKATSMLELIRNIELITGKPAQINYAGRKSFEPMLLKADMAKAEQELRFEPKVTLEDGLRRFVEWYQANGY